MAHIVAIPFTGCSINPARSLGPAIVSGNLQDLWLFIIAPIFGGSLAALTAKYVFGVLEDKTQIKKDDDNLPYDKLFTPARTDERTAQGSVTRRSVITRENSDDQSFTLSMAPLDEEVASP